MTEKITRNTTLTMGQVAKICEVCPKTVHGWIARGNIKGYRIPNSKHRRILLRDLVKFLEDNDMSCFLDKVIPPPERPNKPR